ncbi:ATP-binding protein [Kitasatospora sp. NPDC052868]|uniref:ATP-binding protein n=1 Tax=Kitasatospora sp. NPDC052868 TaxID=3364060 RepID=UPI0037C951A8
MDTGDVAEELLLQCTAESVRLAREFVRHCLAVLRPATPAEKVYDAGLVASELVTNALRHRPRSMAIRVVISASRCRIEVADDGRSAASPPEARVRREPRLGFAVMAGLGTLGHALDADGTVSWVDLALGGGRTTLTNAGPTSK